MRYIITDAGVKFFDDAEAVEIVKQIAAKQREALENAIRPNDAAATVDTGTPAAQRPAAAA